MTPIGLFRSAQNSAELCIHTFVFALSEVWILGNALLSIEQKYTGGYYMYLSLFWKIFKQINVYLILNMFSLNTKGYDFTDRVHNI